MNVRMMAADAPENDPAKLYRPSHDRARLMSHTHDSPKTFSPEYCGSQYIERGKTPPPPASLAHSPTRIGIHRYLYTSRRWRSSKLPSGARSRRQR